MFLNDVDSRWFGKRNFVGNAIKLVAHLKVYMGILLDHLSSLDAVNFRLTVDPLLNEVQQGPTDAWVVTQADTDEAASLA